MLRSFLYIISGDIAIEVGRELLNFENEDITDEDITENIKERIKGKKDFEPDDEEILKLNTVRKTLYKLYSEKLAQFRRIRDKSTGWFIYYWWHEFDLLEEILLEKKKLIQRKLRDRLEFERENYFFICEECGDPNIKYAFEQAFELNFRCPECGGELKAQDNEVIKKFLKDKVIQNQKTSFMIDRED
ncbi:MAG: transcription factor [Candidatus Lokiarchaeota archaeon]|nr:transcription factor [Candidatus Lokiarchaeota archaeon]MBD3198885.1 transcription factor [Candidatus Lokiarchaeota archaeon]